MAENKEKNDDVIADLNNIDLNAVSELKNERMPPRRFQRRRQSQFVPDYIDWKDVDFLKRFVPERAKIMPRRISGISAKDQRRLAKAIKRARSMALLPFVTD